jgi:hypothetical protein
MPAGRAGWPAARWNAEAPATAQAESVRWSDVITRAGTESRGLYRIEDEAEMRGTFQQKDLTKSRAGWLYSYDPLTVPLPA